MIYIYRFKTANTFTILPNSIHCKIVKEFTTIEQILKELEKKHVIPVANNGYT
ncbi:hypothetical protein [Lacinutrix jangbogonensis]|uniref:hypothetical protein n=1 Tax=Lacinutrix jangbogonensis TaxID=1469557 RepID=UPI000A806DFF|nr:hypothetical protein [Lacinutrix jangbogonensis]